MVKEIPKDQLMMMFGITSVALQSFQSPGSTSIRTKNGGGVNQQMCILYH